MYMYIYIYTYVYMYIGIYVYVYMRCAWEQHEDTHIVCECVRVSPCATRVWRFKQPAATTGRLTFGIVPLGFRVWGLGIVVPRERNAP